MAGTRIVTDSTTLFADPSIVRQLPITIVPATVKFGDDVMQLGVDLDHESFVHRLHNADQIPELIPPTVEEFAEIFEHLINQNITEIITIHTASSVFGAHKNAVAAAKLILGRCNVTSIDAENMSAGVGMLVAKAGKMVKDGHKSDEVERTIRHMVNRIYSLFYVDSLEFLGRNGLMRASHSILGSMLDIKPLLSFEDGRLFIIEKSANESQAIDRLSEFSDEFVNAEKAIILSYTEEQIKPLRQLQDRLAVSLNIVNVPILKYGAMISMTLGMDATGLIILDEETELD